MGKVLKKLIIIFAIILILGGGVFAYVYFATDILKTDRQLFYKYITQEADILKIFEDNELKAYNTKKQNTPYENNGKYYVVGMEEYLPEKAQDMNITFNGETDKANRYKYQQVKINYNEDTSMAVDYINNQDYYGIKVEEILTKYLTFENNNLKDFAEKMGVTDLENIPDKIDIDKIKNNIQFTEEEKEELKKIIKNDLKQLIQDEKFSSREDEINIYTLDLTAYDLMNIIQQIAKDLSNNEIIMNKIKEVYKVQNNATDEEATTYIENVKEDINKEIDEIDEETEQINISINLYVQNKKLQKTEITIYETDNEDEKYNIVLGNEENKLNIEFQTYEQQEFETQASLKIEKVKSDDELDYNIVTNVGEYGNIELNIKLNGLQALEKINEQYTLEANVVDKQVKYFLTNQNKFVETINSQVDENQLQIINEYSYEKLTKTIEKLQLLLEQLNNKKMAQIEAEDSTNPIIYYIPFNQLMLFDFDNLNSDTQTSNKKDTSVSTSEEVKLAKQKINAEWTKYYSNAHKQISEENSDITIRDYIVNNWTVSSNESLYSIEDGVITLAIADESGIYEEGYIDENGQITWEE